MSLTPPLLEIESLTKGFTIGGNFRPILNGIDLTIDAGQCVALLGDSGSGKSTLLNVISGIDSPDGGDIRFRGDSIVRMTERERTLYRRCHIGFVYQFFNLIPTLTVTENALLPLELTGQLTATRRAAAIAQLCDLGLDRHLDSFTDSLSGGEQQRVALVRALVHGPSLILADEPTGNLDRTTGDKVLSLLLELVRRGHHTLILVTHSTSHAKVADRMISLVDGELATAG
jgi:putative ABC transport system ATP-binding protein